MSLIIYNWITIMGCSKHELYSTRNMLYSQKKMKQDFLAQRFSPPTLSTVELACENSRFSSLLATWDVSRGGTSATQRQKFHTNDVNQCLHNISGSHGVPNTNLFNFTFLLVDFGKVLCSSTTPAKLKCFLQRRLYSTNVDCFVRDSSRLHLTFVAFCLSFVNNR